MAACLDLGGLSNFRKRTISAFLNWQEACVQTLANRYVCCRTCRTPRAHHVAELRAAAQPTVSDPVYQLDLQSEVRALFLLAESEPPRRPDHRRNLRSLPIPGPNREFEPFGRRTVLTPGIRRNLPPVHSPESGPPDLRADQWLLHREDGQADHGDAKGEKPGSLRG